MPNSENIGIGNPPIENDEGLTAGDFLAQFRGRDYGFGRLRSISDKGNGCVDWSVGENRPGVKPVVRMTNAIVKTWLVPSFQDRSNNVPLHILFGSLPCTRQLDLRWYGFTL